MAGAGRRIEEGLEDASLLPDVRVRDSRVQPLDPEVAAVQQSEVGGILPSQRERLGLEAERGGERDGALS